MDSRDDRKEFMEEQLSRLNIPFERFSAIRPTIESLSSPQGKYFKFYERGTRRIKAYIERERFHTRGQGVLGCYLSHYFIHMQARKEGWGNFLVLEDDCELYPDSIDILNKKINNNDIPSDWDIIRDTWASTHQVATYPSPTSQSIFPGYHSNREKRNNPTVPWTNRAGGTHFQLINCKSLDKILNYMLEDYVYNIDCAYCTNKINVYHSRFVEGPRGALGKFGSDIPKTPHRIISPDIRDTMNIKKKSD